MFSLKDKTALVTGSTFGIGLGILKVFARAGANVVMNGRRKPEDHDALMADLSSHGNKAIFVQGDVTKAGERGRMLKESLDAFGRFDILVNNAGSFFDHGWSNLTEEIFDQTFNLNVKGMLFTSRLAIEHFRSTGQRGSIVMVGSVNSFASERGTTCYDMSKGAILMMTRALAVETFKDNINVNALCPGLVDTPLVRRLIGDEAKFRTVGEGVPKGRWCTIEECGYAALYLVSDEGSYMTGQHIILDGGILAVQYTRISDLGTEGLGT
ncbi:MAG: glucose 1-dehydrogenase [Verrucomicrobia bacterium]|nr:glucose 1-dehydrogenase [Verrucomicrobiota bacterium]